MARAKKQPEPELDPVFDDDAAPAPDDASLKSVRELGALQVRLEKEVNEAEEALKVKKAALTKVQEGDLPAALLAIGMKGFQLDTGHKVELLTTHHAGIPKEKKPEAFVWLRKHNFGEMIKREISLAFGRGQDKVADKLVAQLRAKYSEEAKIQDEEAVHGGTLGAFVREQIAQGTELPHDLLGIYTRRATKITPPKNIEL